MFTVWAAGERMRHRPPPQAVEAAAAADGGDEAAALPALRVRGTGL